MQYINSVTLRSTIYIIFSLSFMGCNNNNEIVSGNNKILTGEIISARLISCPTSQASENMHTKIGAFSITETSVINDLTPEQEASLDALNTLQVNTDQMNKLYSTFANIDQPFYPADTSFIITQSEFLGFMKQFVSQNCTKLGEQIRTELAEKSVLAQKKYTLLYCNKDSKSQEFGEIPPMSGTWVLPNVLGLRDVIIKW